MLEASPVEQQLRAFLFGSSDQIVDSFKELLVGDWGDVDVLVAGADLEGFSFGHQVRDPFSALANEDRDTEGHASLASGAEGSGSQGVEAILLVCVGHDHAVVLGSHVDLAAFEGLAGVFVDVVAGLVSADEGDCSDVGVLADVFDCLEAALHDVHDALRHAALFQKLDEVSDGAWDTLARLDDVGVSSSDGHGEHPELEMMGEVYRDHRREVEGADAGADTEWNTVAVSVDAFGDVADGLPLHDVSDSAGCFDDFEAADDISSGVSKSLPMLCGDDLGNLVDIGADSGLEVEHVPLPSGEGDLGPGFEGGFSGSDGFVEFLGMRRRGTDLVVCGVIPTTSSLRGERLSRATGPFESFHWPLTKLEALEI